MVSMLSLNWSKLSMSLVVLGREFHILMALGKNEFRCPSILEGGRMNDFSFLGLVFNLLMGMVVIPC